MSLIQAIKNLLKRILPPPVHAFNREVARILGAIEAEGQSSRGEVAALAAQVQLQQQVLERMLAELAALQAAEAAGLAEINGRFDGVAAALGKALEGLAGQLDGIAQQGRMLEEVAQGGFRQVQEKQIAVEAAEQERTKTLSTAVERSRQQAAAATRSADEAVWAAIFNNTITHSTWLLDKTFSPGRWAVGYPYLYAMYRVLNEARPKRILELGLGQSTRMIAQYAAAFDDVEHIVVEQDEEWASFFAKKNSLGKNTRIYYLPVVEANFLTDDKTLVYYNFEEIFGGLKFDFISIDGPAQSRSNLYRRIELLKLIPDGLENSFCVFLDDYNVTQCENMWKIAMEKMKEKNIQFADSIYSGKKSVAICCSIDKKYLCSM